MADFTDRVKLVFEAVTGDATGQVGKLKSGVAESESAFGKLKGAAGSAISTIANSPVAMAGAGVAIAKVAFDLAKGFEDAAISAQNFSTASGLSVQDASRWQEVAGDVGVNTETLEGAVNKLNIAASKGTLTTLGIGGDDTNTKLLNALEHLQGITDSSDRARQGMALFGKSWAQLAPLVEEAGSLRDNLASVSDQRVIDPAEVVKAERMRDAMDNLSDKLDAVKLAAGGALIDTVSQLATVLGRAADGAEALSNAAGGIGDVASAIGGFLNPLDNLSGGLDRATDSSRSWTDRLNGAGDALVGSIPIVGGFISSLGGSSDASDDAADAESRRKDATNIAAQAAKDAADAAADEESALRSLTDATLASFNSTLGLADASDKTTDAIGKYTTANDTAAQSSYGSKTANDALADAQRSAEQAALAQAAAAAKLVDDQAKANGEVATAAERNAAMADSLHAVAGTLSADSPLRRSLEAYATQIEQVPDHADTTFTANTKTAAEQVQALTDSIYAIAGKIFSFVIKPSASSASSVPAPTGTSMVLTAPSSGDGVSRGLSAVPGLAPVAPLALGPASSAPTVINNYVSVAPFTNPAEVGRAIADMLDAFYRRSGQRRPVAA